MSVQVLIDAVALLIPVAGYGWWILSTWERLKRKIKDSPNPKRAFYTTAFLYFSAVILGPLVVLLLFFAMPVVSAVMLALIILFGYGYIIYRISKFMVKGIGSSESKYKVTPAKPEIAIFRDPKITVSVKEFSKHSHTIAPTGRGKTQSALAPIAKQFLEIGKGVLIIDPKGDNSIPKAFISLLKEMGTYPDGFWYFDVMKPRYSLSYNPLYSGIKYNKPEHIAVMVISTMPRVGGTATFYENIQREFTRAITRLLSVIPRTGKMANFLDLYSIVAFLPKSIQYLLDTYSEELRGDEKDEIYYLWLRSIYEEAKRNKEFRSYLRGLQQHLSLYAFSFHPRLLNSYDPDIKIAEGFRQGKLMYFSLRALDFPSGESLDIGKMILMDIQSYAAFKQREGLESEVPDMVFIDEAHNVIVPEFQRMFEMARSAGIGIMLIHQSKQQLDEIKKGMFENIFNNTNIKLILGAEDPETKKYLAEYFGQELKFFINVTKGGENPFKRPLDAVLPHWSEIAMQRYDYKIRPEEFSELEIGTAILAVGPRNDLKGVKGKLYRFASDVKGKLDYYLVPVNKADRSWKDKGKGLCLLSEFINNPEFKEVAEEDSEEAKKKLMEAVNSILGSAKDGEDEQPSPEDLSYDIVSAVVSEESVTSQSQYDDLQIR